ncbi:DUF3679 domain-containing protein [Bacillus manliponensis]|uniref:DUF3679 domain-containing protein n=1 Tax=Bacillus manliponensis TaxID=574376 RepID=UPI00068E7117|nr:DUF3679 domain-containing protein [Bacillus manliponensis]
MDGFTRKYVIIVIIMFCVVFVGMQITSNGLKQMKGYSDLTFEEVTSLTGTARTGIEETLFKKSFSITEKKRQLEELKSFNMLEGAGKGVTLLVKSFVRTCTNIVIDKIQSLFSLMGTKEKGLSYKRVR